MARNLCVAFFAAIIVVALFQSSAAQTTYTVGGNAAWGIPSGGAAFYSNWAANQTFSVGDSLVFNFANNQHDVTTVSKADFDSCTATNPISRVNTSPARITINATGDHHFICGFPGHCGAGQKLTINVRAATTPAPSPQPSAPSPSPRSSTPSPVSAPSPAPVSTPPSTPPTTIASPPSTIATPPSTIATPPSTSTTPSSPSPAGATAAPPSDNSAKSLGVAGLSATFLSIVVAFLY